ncbi:MAG: dTDP-glucose 4,6-dehydratase [uncultured Nocardioidaceae bacterium]|uniref:dTDP-glucose 4,6-dehydratase n=1 Tax=uncultured Nocardioidaceae bacterium TaxID=253824 RepID=A0A6J4LB04_9ACTN|nr:MAG: dTDP-glucose 4,6-dehydratase [uncultured Nocardioidaceae bacterium]
MRAVVVGGAGFLGGAIAEELLRRGDSVVVFDELVSTERCAAVFGPGAVEIAAADMLDAAALSDAFSGADEVYHLAGILGTSELEERVQDAIISNIAGAVGVFEAAIECRVPRVFFPAKPNVWRNTYTITKYAAEQFAQMYAATGQVAIPTLRYFNGYGPRQCLGPVRKLVPTFVAQALSGLPLTVYGDGQQTVDMIYSRDLARHTVDFTRSGYIGEPVDLGRGVEMSVLDVASAVNRVVGSDAGIVHLPMRRGETPSTHLVADNRPLERLLGPLHFTDFTTSLEETVVWYARLPRDDIRGAVEALEAA